MAKRIGKTRVIAETGAGQHGVATATVCAKLGMECVIYMGAEDARRQALNVFRIEMLGAKVIHSFPSLHDNLTFPRGCPSICWFMHTEGCYKRRLA